MRDTELRNRLLELGMPARLADRTAAELRDRVHPVATVAALKVSDHLSGLAMQDAYGTAGLAGYEVDPLSGLLKSIKKVAKKAVKAVGKVASVVAPVVPVAAVVAVGAHLITKKKDKAEPAPTVQTVVEAAPVPTPAQAVKEQSALPIKRKVRKAVRVPAGTSREAAAVAAEAVQGGYPADTASLMQAMLAAGGTNMASPAAQAVLRDVATEGIIPTAEGPAALPGWVKPVGIGVAALGVVLLLKRRK